MMNCVKPYFGIYPFLFYFTDYKLKDRTL